MSNFAQDIKYAIRLILKRPGFAAMAILTLALGIGANSAIFSVVNSVLLRPLPFDEPDRLVWIWDTQPQLERAPASLADFLDWREQNQSFERIAAYQDGRMFFDRGDTAEDVRVGLVTPDFFSVMRAQPILGRTFNDDETQPGKFRVAVLSYGLWQRRFGSDPDVLGQTLNISRFPYTIIGVMPPGFDFPNRAEMWRPLPIDPAQVSRGPHFLRVVARLKPGVTLDEAQSEMATIAARLSEQHAQVNAGHNVKLELLHEVAVGNARPILLVLLGAVGFVLLIACANVANLLLARAVSRQKEMAIRTALGATRSRILKQLLTESALLALAGGALGLLIGVWGVKALVAISPDNIPRSQTIRLDYWVVGFTFAISVVTGIAFGLIPALQTSKTDLNESLKEGGRGSSEGRRRNRARSLLVIAEVALTLVPLVGAGLMIKSFMRLVDEKPGFDTDNTLTIGVVAFRPPYPEDTNVAALYRQLSERFSNTSGVEAVGAINDVPLSGGNSNTSFTVEGRAPIPKEQHPLVEYRVITPGYFKAMNIPVISGRDVAESDTKETPNVAVVSETFARLHFPDESPVGHRIFLQGQQRGDPLRIIGVVGDVRHFGLDEKPAAEAYVPYLQNPLGDSILRAITFVIRASNDPAAMVATLREEALAIDRSLPMYSVETLSERLGESLSRRRFNMTLLAVFAGVALLLAAVGIYGVVSYSVTQRTHEIGIRMALGARARDIVGMVAGQAMTLVLIGVVIGLVAAYLLTSFAQSLLYEVSATDPLTFAGISLLLVGVALLACAVPARRATRVDPMIALRYE